MATPRQPLRRLREKIVVREAAAARARQTRSLGRTVVWTNGCFDLLHHGHVAYLEAARALGDVLIVGVNGDESVERLKGPGRPLVPLAGRLQVVAALESVDWVTWFDEDTPLETIVAVQPHVICKGGDYRPESVAGAGEARAWGGRVEILPFVAGTSTSAIIARVQAER